MQHQQIMFCPIMHQSQCTHLGVFAGLHTVGCWTGWAECAELAESVGAGVVRCAELAEFAEAGMIEFGGLLVVFDGVRWGWLAVVWVSTLPSIDAGKRSAGACTAVA